MPNLVSKHVTVFHSLKRDIMSVIVRLSTERFLIGQVLNLYKRDADSRYGSLSSWHRLRSVYLDCHYVFTNLYNSCVSLISLCSYLTFLS